MAARADLGVPEGSLGVLGKRRGRGVGTGEAGVPIGPAQVRRAPVGSGCLEPGATRSLRALSRLSQEPWVRPDCPGVCAYPLGWCLPCNGRPASPIKPCVLTVSPEPSFLCWQPELPGRRGKVWWAYGLYSQSVGLGLFGLCSWLVLSGRKGLEKQDRGRGASRKLLPLLFWWFCKQLPLQVT